MWITICFDTEGDFAKPSYIVEYEGYQIEIKKGTPSEGHNLHIETTHYNDSKAHEGGRRFLSEVAWLFDYRVEILAWGGGSHKTPVNVWQRSFSRIGNAIHLEDYEQIAFDYEQKLALGLYREGISSNSNFYKFLSYFKIINIKYHTGSEQKQWINDNISKIRINTKLLSEFEDENIDDVGEHLYNSGRCAIAHASIQSGDLIADADNYDDNIRIARELPLIKELSEIFIMDELGVPNKFQARRVRLMKEFRKLFSDKTFSEILDHDDIDVDDLPEMPKMSFRVYEEAREYYTLSNLDLQIMSAGKGKIVLSNLAQDWPLKTAIVIDFENKEIKFDVADVRVDESHVEFSDRFRLDYYYFLKAYFLNGRLEIWNDESKVLLARLEPYIPVNIHLGTTLDNFEQIIRHLEEKIRDQE